MLARFPLVNGLDFGNVSTLCKMGVEGTLNLGWKCEDPDCFVFGESNGDFTVASPYICSPFFLYINPKIAGIDGIP
jgi:hypothetical protein